MEYNSGEIQYGEDNGDRLFIYDEADGAYAGAVKLKRAFKSPIIYYFCAVLLALLGWIIYGYVFAPEWSVVRQSNIVDIIRTVFVYLFLSAFTIVIVFRLWEKLLKFATRGAQDSVADDEIIAKVLEKKKYRSALAVYETYIEIVNLSVSKFYEKNQIRSILVRSSRDYFTVILVLRDVKFATADVVIPTEFLGDFIRACGDIDVSVENNSKRKEKIRADKSKGELVGLTIFLLVPIAVGALIIWLHNAVNEKIPDFLGIFFILCGVMALCGLYDFIPFVKRVVFPFMAGITFTAGPMLLVSALLQEKGFALTAYNFIHSLDAIVLGMTYISAIGVYCLIYAVRMAIDYFVYSAKNK